MRCNHSARSRLATLVAGCSATLALGVDPYACNFLTDASVSCMLPWPDNFFLGNGQLTLQPESLPASKDGQLFNVTAGGWQALQGFSPIPQITAYMPNCSLDLSGLPRWWNLSGDSLDPTATSLLLNTATNKPLLHWTEMDESVDSGPTGSGALIMWPSARLQDATQYVVAYRGLLDVNGNPMVPSDGFLALRDKVPTSNPALEAARPRFEKIFATLEAMGWQRQELQLAWDFTTNTRENVTGAMVYMRDDAFARVGNGSNMQYTITSVQNNYSGNISRVIKGTLMAPLYLNSAEPGVEVRLVLNPGTGLPVFQGYTPVNFTVLIPQSLAGNGTRPAHAGKVMLYGHGLFGSQEELFTDYLVAEANQYGYVMGGVDWWGLCKADIVAVAAMLITDLSDFAMVPDRLHQGMLNALLMSKLLTHSAFTRDPVVTWGNVSVISLSTSDHFYYGNSDGGIMGTVFTSLTTDMLSSVIGVGGGPFSLLLPRSHDFSAAWDVLCVRYPDPLARLTLLPVLQALWDRLEPAGYVSFISGNTLPGTPQHRVLFHYGLGDGQVTWLGGETLARSVGAVMFASNVREHNETLAGFPLVPDNTVLSSGNAIMGWQFIGVPPVPLNNTPPSDGYDTHEYTRRAPTSQQQSAHFFFTGQIVNTCGGACVVPIPPM